MIFAWFCRSNFPICLTIICMAIPIVFFSSLSTWRFQNYFVRFKYTIRGPIGRSVISFNSHSHYSPYNDSPPYLCFPFVVNDTNIVGLALDVVLVFFMIWARIFNIRFFNVTSEVCILVTIGVKPIYITSFWLPYFWLKFSYFGCIGGIQILC
jgi:hypothetical protein